MIDFVTDLNTIEETLARGKSIVKESIDLTRKNAERKREIERKLQQCFSVNSQVKHQDNSFTLDLENNQLSIISKEKTHESYLYNEDTLKAQTQKIEELERNKKYTQKKFEELQDILKDLEEENLALKGKIRSLVYQVKESEGEMNHLSEEYMQLKKENQRILKENQEVFGKYEKVVKENLELRENPEFLANFYRRPKDTGEAKGIIVGATHLKGRSGSNHKTISFDDRVPEFPLESESSTENYQLFFKNLKKGAIDPLKTQGKLTPAADSKDQKPLKIPSKSETAVKKKSKNEDIVDKLEENYKKTDEKFRKISSNLVNHSNGSGKKKLSISFDNIKHLHTEGSKPKISSKVKQKRPQVKSKKPSKK